jgi:hypothetical protein
VNAARRTGLLVGITVFAGILLVTKSLWPVVGPLTQRTELAAAARSTDAGVPVPTAARPCAAQDPSLAGSTRWCLPTGVSAQTIARWYAARLPAGRDAGPLRWCVEQRQADGSRQALWSNGTGLVGYVLPPQPPHPQTASIDGRIAVTVVTLPGSSCPAAARVSREQA